MKNPFIPRPLTMKGKILLWAILLECIAIWGIGFYAYSTLPAEVFTHFDASSKPTSYGDKSMFLILPIVFSIAPIIFY